MSTITLIYILLTIVISAAIAFFQYFFNVQKKPKINRLLFILKALSLFLIGLLFINPKITSIETTNIKPVLSVLIDNSSSVNYFKETTTVTSFVEEIKQNKAINKKFDLNLFTFGNNVRTLDSLSFEESQTNINKSIKTVSDLQKNKLGTIVLLSDGNQTTGSDYEFTQCKKPIYPIVLGDTTQHQDIRISQLNVNKYSYIKNKFPVETLLHYDGNKTIKTLFTIKKDGKKVFSKNITLSKENNTKTITTNLTSEKEGLHYYSVAIGKIKNEKNTKNNYKSFSVEVLNEQTKVLILASILHPDLGALKKSIESNKQRKVDIKLINSFNKKINDYQLVIFYQPNNYFKRLFQQRDSNYLVITGTKTNWKFINNLKLPFSKDAINQTELYSASYNDKFIPFNQKDIGFDQYPPLKDKFGVVTINSNTNILLYQKVLNMTVKEPLIATFEEGSSKTAAIFGEGIWKWRATNYREEQNFEQFDAFTSNLVQLLASNKKRERLQVKAERLYSSNSNSVISALYLDENYRFDSRASLQITLKNIVTKKTTTVPMSLVNNSYQVEFEALPAGTYAYKVAVVGQNIKKHGRFKVDSYQIEEQFTNSNSKKLEQLATKTGGKHYYKEEVQALFKDLLANKKYFTTQKATKKEENLIEWKWILLLIIGLLSAEWFIRKYHGKI